MSAIHASGQGDMFPLASVEVAASISRRLCPGPNQPINDLHMTPPELAQQVVDHFAPRGRLLDPCRGSGAFYDAMLKHSHDVDWCEITDGRDFLQYWKQADWIITNPPWSKAAFVEVLGHALRLAGNIVFLVCIPTIATDKRLRMIEAAGFGVCEIVRFEHPPSPWLRNGFRLAAVLIKRGAPSVLGTVGRGPAPLWEAVA